MLEEKHSEEIRLYGAKLGHANQRIESLESKLQEQTQRRDKIAQQLHKIMEVQWLEAIKLLNNNKMPSSPDIYNDQFNQLKSKSYSNLEELLSPKESPEDDRQYNKELVQSVDETPVNSKPHKSRQQIESELQKYVQMVIFKSILSIVVCYFALNYVWYLVVLTKPCGRMPYWIILCNLQWTKIIY